MTDNLIGNKKLEEFKRELKASLPNREIIDRASFLAVEFNGLMIVLKDRYRDGLSKENIKREFVYYKKENELPTDYHNLSGKSIIIDFNFLTQRGKQAIYKFAKGEY